MLQKNILALFAGAASMLAGVHQAAAIDAGLPEPAVIYANQNAEPPAPARTAYADRPNLGGGFIEFLFGDQQQQAGRYQQQPNYPQPPVYQQQPSYDPRAMWPGAPQAQRSLSPQGPPAIKCARPR